MPNETLAARVCTCGHSAYWHAAGSTTDPGGTQGEGRCEGGRDCACRRFELDHVDTYESLRAQLAREKGR